MKWFFNKNFKSASGNKPFVRVGVVLDNGTMFGVQCDMSKISRRFSEFTHEERKINGVDDKAMSFEEFCLEFKYFDMDKREMFKICILDLSRAFRNHVTVSSNKGFPISSGNQTEVYSSITKKRDDVLKLFDSTYTFVPEDEKVWEEIDSVGIEDEDLMNEIIESVFAHKDKEVVVRGNTYILKQKEDSSDIAIYIKKSKSSVKKEEPVIEKKEIKTKKMAFCVECDDLVNFNKNELYEIVSSQKEYLVVKDIFGEERSMRSSRFRIFDVEEELVEG